MELTATNVFIMAMCAAAFTLLWWVVGEGERRNASRGGTYSPPTEQQFTPPPPPSIIQTVRQLEEQAHMEALRQHFAEELVEGKSIWEVELIIAGYGTVEHTVAKHDNPADELVGMMSDKGCVTFTIRAYPETATYRTNQIKGVSAVKVLDWKQDA